MTDPRQPYEPGQTYPQQGYSGYPQQGYQPQHGYGDEGSYARGYYQDERPPAPRHDNRPADYGYHGGERPPRRKRRRVFMWVFFAVQALFILWLVVGLATVHTGPTTAQLASACYHHHWWPLFKSQADCVTHYGGALTSAGNLGKGIGAALIIVLWMVVDVILGVSYGVYRLATRNRWQASDRHAASHAYRS